MFKGKRKQKFGQCDVIYNASQQNKNAGNKNTRDTQSKNTDINFRNKTRSRTPKQSLGNN